MHACPAEFEQVGFVQSQDGTADATVTVGLDGCESGRT